MSQEMLGRIKFKTKMMARELGLQNSHSDYCKFIVVGKGRSGSNFLRTLLDSHSQIFTYGELFRNFNRIDWGRSDYNKYLQSPEMVEFMQNKPADFVEKEVFRKLPKKISAVGFKIFYQHAQGDSREVIWDYFESQKDIKIIHLKRENYLKRFLSFKKALLTNEWRQTKPNGEAKEIKITLTYEECLQDFLEMRKNQEMYDDYFKDHSKMDLIYERLSNDREKEMKRVQDFLGISYEPLQPKTRKQSSQPLSEAISNYFELKERFQSTPWEPFFED